MGGCFEEQSDGATHLESQARDRHDSFLMVDCFCRDFANLLFDCCKPRSMRKERKWKWLGSFVVERVVRREREVLP